MLIDDHDERFLIGDSTIVGAGIGLFARVPLRSGDKLAVTGVLVRRDSISDRATHFADEHKFRVGDDLLLIPMGLAGMVNHSQQPNLVKVFEGESVFLEALRDIAAGEELFFTYTQYAQERFGLK